MAKAKKKVVKKAAPKKAVKKKSVSKKKAPKKAAVAPKKKASPAKKKTPQKAVAKKSSGKKASAQKAKTSKPVASKTVASTAPRKMKDLTSFVTPLDDRVIVRLKEIERKTAGGLFIPDSVADVSGNLEGLIVAVGRGHRDNKGRVRPMDVKAGDHVIFSEFAGTKIRLMDEDFVILREGDLAGVRS